MRSTIIVCDFDGTLSLVDMGRALLDRFTGTAWRKHNERWTNGEISLPELQRIVWGEVRATEQEMLSYVQKKGQLRKGSDQLFQAADEGRLQLVLASGGFGFYIESLLGHRLKHFSERFYNRLQTSSMGALPEFLYPELSCERCAICKAKVVRRYLGEEQRVVFCGDGNSDRCAAKVAQEIFVVKESRLEQYCIERDIAHTAFDDFQTVIASVTQNPYP